MRTLLTVTSAVTTKSYQNGRLPSVRLPLWLPRKVARAGGRQARGFQFGFHGISAVSSGNLTIRLRVENDTLCRNQHIASNALGACILVPVLGRHEAKSVATEMRCAHFKNPGLNLELQKPTARRRDAKVLMWRSLKRPLGATIYLANRLVYGSTFPRV